MYLALSDHFPSSRIHTLVLIDTLLYQPNHLEPLLPSGVRAQFTVPISFLTSCFSLSRHTSRTKPLPKDHLHTPVLGWLRPSHTKYLITPLHNDFLTDPWCRTPADTSSARCRQGPTPSLPTKARYARPTERKTLNYFVPWLEFKAQYYVFLAC